MIQEFIKLIENSGIIVSSKQNMRYREKIGDFLNTIDKSVLILFMLTNDYLKTEQFIEEIKYAKQLNKIILLIQIEDIGENLKDNISEFLDFKQFNEIIDINCKHFKRVFIYILRAFGKEGNLVNSKEEFYIKSINWSFNNNEYCKEFPIKSFNLIWEKDFEYEWAKSTKIESIFVNKTTKENIIVSTNGLYDLNVNDFIINELANDYEFTNSFCYIEHLQQYCGIVNIQNNYNLVSFDQKSFHKIEIKILPEIFQNSRLSMIYSEINRKTYIFINEKKCVQVFDENLKSEKLMPLKYQYMIFNIYIHNDRFYTPDASINVIHVYDLNINYLTSFGYSILGPSLSLHFDIINNTNYVFAKSQTTLYAFNLGNYKFVGKMPVDQMDNYSCFTNKKFIEVPRKERCLKIFNIDYKIFRNKFIIHNGLHLAIDQKYICKLNPLNIHLYRNEYLLPCGNYACLDCIYDNFNIFTKTLTCSFDNCKIEHRLKTIDIKPCSYIINENVYNISEQLLDYEKYVLEDMGELNN